MVCGRQAYDREQYADIRIGVSCVQICLGRCAAIYTALEALVLVSPEAARFALRRVKGTKDVHR